MPNPRVAHCVFCEDIRHELGNKISMMGIFTNELILFGTLPAIMPSFAVVAWLICDVGDEPSELKVRLTGPPNPSNETLLLEGGFTNIRAQPNNESGTKVQIRVVLQMAGLPLAGEGELEAFIDTETGSLRAGRLKIKSQSPPADAGETLSTGAPITTIKPSRRAARPPSARKKKAKKA